MYRVENKSFSIPSPCHHVSLCLATNITNLLGIILGLLYAHIHLFPFKREEGIYYTSYSTLCFLLLQCVRGSSIELPQSNSCKIFYMDISWYIYLNPLICYWWTFALFPSFCYYKQCFNRCPCTHDISHAWESIYTKWISKRTVILLLLCTYVVPTYISMIRYKSTGLIAPS